MNDFTRLRYVLLVCSFFLCLRAGAQENKQPARKPVHPEIHAGITAGGHLYNGRFIYRTGKVLQLGASVHITERISLGLSAGAEKFENELFLPVALNFTGMLRKKSNSPFLSTQAGYASASNNKMFSYANYDYHGGWMFSQGFGYRFSVKDKYGILVNAGYKHQFARISYFTPDNTTYTEPDNFNLVYFRIGLQL